MLANDTKIVVRLPQADKRHIKSLAAREGLTLRQAMHQAFQAWEAQLQSRADPADPMRGTLAGADAEKRGQPNPVALSSGHRRDAAAKPAPQSLGGQPEGRKASAPAWLRGAARLDWSKCGAVQSVPGKTGKVWVVRGTHVPLAAVLKAVAEGHPFAEIAEVYQLPLQPLLAILQFAVQGGAGFRPG